MNRQEGGGGRGFGHESRSTQLRTKEATGVVYATCDPGMLAQKASKILLLTGELSKEPRHSGTFSVNTSELVK